MNDGMLLELVAVSCGIAVAALTWSLGEIPPLVAPTGGIRGLRRAALVRADSAYLRLEPIVLRVGGWLAAFISEVLGRFPSLRAPILNLVQRQEEMLRSAGQPAGLEVYSFWALSVLSGLVTLGCVFWQDEPLVVSLRIPLVLAGVALPGLRVAALRTERLSTLAREIPACIDLIALSMNAGSDFTGALRRVTEGQVGVVADELGLVLAAIDLGVTRAGALRALEARVPVPEVRDLVRAVVLSEQKGASLADALAQLSVSSRHRRSVRGEEAAARAGVLLMAPMMLLVACVLILILGPMLVGGIGL